MAKTHTIDWRMYGQELQDIPIGLSDNFTLSDSLSVSASGNQRLGLHVTSDELAIWQDRTVNGPYKTTGDVSTNSPGDWTRIVSYATQLSGNPTQERWLGNDSGDPFYENGVHASCTYGQPCVPGNLQGQIVLNAAFATLVDPTNHNYIAAVRTALLDQIAIPGVDFTNETIWPDHSLTDGWVPAITNFLTRLVFAYSYVRNNAAFSSSERLAIDTWFSEAAYYWAKQPDHIVRSQIYPNRNTEFDATVDVGGTYATGGPGDDPVGYASYITHYDCNLEVRGNLSPGYAEVWSNRSASINRFAAAGSLINGSLPNDAQTQRWVKMWIKEFLTYGTFANGMIHEYKWWAGAPNMPTLGWHYSSFAIGPIVSAADMFARAGDTSLYTFTTSAGWEFSQNPPGFNANTSGGPKSIQAIIQRHYSFVPQRVIGEPGWVGNDDIPTQSGGPHCGDVDWLIQPLDNPHGVHRTAEQNYTMANLYFNDANHKAAYMRTMTGAPAYPANPENYLNPWTGEWNVYPGPLFMFGQMEGLVNPYP